MKFIKICIPVFILLILVACSDIKGQDNSAEIEENVSAFVSENTSDFKFQSPSVFHDYKADEKYEVSFSQDVGFEIKQPGNIKSNETKLEYTDLSIQSIDVYRCAEEMDFAVSENKKENLAAIVSFISTSAKTEFKKYTVNENDFYLFESFMNNRSVVNVYYNIGESFFFAHGYLVSEKEISDTTAKKICKDLSPIE